MTTTALLEVVVVDDDQGTLGLAEEALADVARVRPAGTLAAALRACAERLPDCVVLDLGLPDAEGLEALVAVVQAHPGLPVVVLTGRAETEAVDAALQAGADDYVHKDALSVQLPHAVHYAVGRTRRRARLRGAVSAADALLAALADAAVVRHADGSVAAANAAAQELLALHRAEDGRWADGPRGQASADGAVRVPGADGVQRWVECDVRPLLGDDGDVLGVVEVYRDVTARTEAREEARFRAELLDAVGQAVIATDADGHVTYWNSAAEQLYGWSAREALGRPVVALTPAEHSREQAEQIMAAMRAGLTWTGDFPVRRRDGSLFTALVTNRPLVDGQGRTVGVIGVSTDVTARVRAERAARRLSAVVDSSGDAIMLETLDGVVEAWNAAAERLYGWTAEEAVGRHLHDLIVPADRRDELAHMQDRVRQGDTVRDVETVRCRRDGSEVAVAVTMSPVLGADGTVDGASAIARDITERRAWESTLRHAALHDELTGLPNRVLLADRLDQAQATSARTGDPLALLFLDLDAFKVVNDAEGHLLGDQLLVAVAERLSAGVRPGDTVARFGGDEFVVLLPGADAEEAVHVAERLLAAVREPVELGARRLHVSVSIGVAHAPPVAPASLLRAADAAVYEAKSRGRGQVVSFVGELSRQAERRLLLSVDLREELSAGTGALHLVHQPIVSLRTGALLGTEALLRWDHPRLGVVPPSEFVPVAEAAGLAAELDAWVLHRATAEIAATRRAGHLPETAYVAVNVAAANVGDSGFPGAVRDALAASGLPATSLVLEVTETGVMRDVDQGVRVLTALCDAGVRLAIDDFGTGWASLTYVRRLPASMLKLDRTFVSALADDEDDLAIAASVVQLGRTTRMTVVAEGVETPQQLAALRDLGCDAGQGYLWTAGVRVEDLPAALADVASASPAPRQRAASPAPRRRSAPAPGPEHGLERMWELHGEGASSASIAAALNREGFRTPTGQRWHVRSVHRLLSQPALAQLTDVPAEEDERVPQHAR